MIGVSVRVTPSYLYLSLTEIGGLLYKTIPVRLNFSCFNFIQYLYFNLDGNIFFKTVLNCSVSLYFLQILTTNLVLYFKLLIICMLICDIYLVLEDKQDEGCLVCVYVTAVFCIACLNVLLSYIFVRERLGEKRTALRFKVRIITLYCQTLDIFIIKSH